MCRTEPDAGLATTTLEPRRVLDASPASRLKRAPEPIQTNINSDRGDRLGLHFFKAPEQFLGTGVPTVCCYRAEALSTIPSRDDQGKQIGKP
jgi:hypothetical protein